MLWFIVKSMKMLKNRILKLSLRILFFITLWLIVYNEILVYLIHRLRWNYIPCDKDCTRILFVADPQILGETFDKNFYQGLAIYDSDHYLKKTFSHAVEHSEPNIICFMGDLMDEGSVATAPEYTRYLDRFKDIYRTATKVELMHIPGDNDIGGERSDLVTEFKANRFKQAFNERSFLQIKQFYRLLNVNLLAHKYPELKNDKDYGFNLTKNIALTHISFLTYPGYFSETIETKIKPDLIFSAHHHLSRVLTYSPLRLQDFVDNSILTVLLDSKMNTSQKKITEIMIPTCSYRMGVRSVGFGMAILAEGGHVQYTVLWLPDRLFALWLYISLLFAYFICGVIWLTTKIKFFRKCSVFHRLLRP